MVHKRLRLPQGTEGFYLEEAYTHKKLLRSFEDVCSSWGYLPVQTPVFDYHDLYRELSGPSSRTSYRLVDRDGDVLVLRSDVTLFLARQMGMMLQPDDPPVRVYYGDTILRHEDPNDLSKNEFFQIGAELIGTAGVEADAEIVLLLLEVSAALGADGSRLHMGSRALLRNSGSDERFAHAIQIRNWPHARTLLEESGASDERIVSLLALYRFIGGADDLASLLKKSHGLLDGEREAVTDLLDLATTIAEAGQSERILLDLSEVGDREYYSGLVFHLYDEGADAPVASGGRYDELLGSFGTATPSVGFSIMLRRLQSRLPASALPGMPQVERAEGDSFVERVRDASRRRSAGKVVKL